MVDDTSHMQGDDNEDTDSDSNYGYQHYEETQVYPVSMMDVDCAETQRMVSVSYMYM
jgi:hypothetical protein